MSKYEIIETKETECKQAVIFARVSSQKQENGVSKEAQISAMTSYCNNLFYYGKLYHWRSSKI